jgi:hypothetical protein
MHDSNVQSGSLIWARLADAAELGRADSIAWVRCKARSAGMVNPNEATIVHLGLPPEQAH